MTIPQGDGWPFGTSTLLKEDGQPIRIPDGQPEAGSIPQRVCFATGFTGGWNAAEKRWDLSSQPGVDGPAGPTGATGAKGATGSAGTPGYAVLTSGFTQPSVSGNVTGVDYTGLAPGNGSYIDYVEGEELKGRYLVSADSGSDMTLTLIQAGTVAPGGSVPSGGVVFHAGAVGPQGPTGPAGFSSIITYEDVDTDTAAITDDLVWTTVNTVGVEISPGGTTSTVRASMISTVTIGASARLWCQNSGGFQIGGEIRLHIGSGLSSSMAATLATAAGFTYTFDVQVKPDVAGSVIEKAGSHVDITQGA